MNIPYELQLGWRYTRAGKRRNSFISFISAVSIAGIALGVATLIIVLSVMNGFQKEVRDRMLSVLAHIEIYAYDGALPDWRRTAALVKQNKSVVAVAPFVAGQALLARGDAMQGVVVRGIDPLQEPAVSDVGKEMRRGALTDLRAGDFGIVLGIDLARSLGVQVGDKVTLVSP
ncbi:MAG: ABC transporter permease, partial [Betaproteobacteria bacterium]|nr:ABC transporter permease [Betaproteobacteria bacterium]